MSLLMVEPTSSQLLGINRRATGYMLNGAVAFYVEDYGNDQEVIAEAKRLLDVLQQNSAQLKLELDNYSAGVPHSIRDAVISEKARRQQEHQRKQDLLDQLP